MSVNQQEPEQRHNSQAAGQARPLLDPSTQHGHPPASPSHPDTELEAQQLQLGEEGRPARTGHQRLVLLLLGSSLCAAVLGLVYYLQTEGFGGKQAGTVTECVSRACQRASARLSVSVDPFAQPCDYYLYACGSDGPASEGKQTAQGQHHQGKRGALDGDLEGGKMLERRSVLILQLREILESESSSGSAMQKAKGFYRSCLDTESIESAGAEPFLTLIQKLGGWAVSGQWNQTDFNSTLSVLIRQYSSFPFFNLYMGEDPNEVARGISRKYIQIDQPNVLIPIEWNNETHSSHAKTQTLRPFLASCLRYLALLGAPSNSSDHHVGAFISLSSELAVAAAPLSYRIRAGQLNRRMTVRELQNQAPAIDWLRCLQAAFYPRPVTQDDYVLLHNLPYIVQMSQVIRNWLNKHELRSSAPLHTYMFLNLLHTFMPALDSRFSETERIFSAAMGNTEPVVPRWRQCVTETEKGFDTILTHLISEMTSQREAEEMFLNIFSVLKEKFADLHWGDENTRQFVRHKVQSLTPRLWIKIENPSEAELGQLFSKVTINPRRYFSNYIELLSLQRDKRNKPFSPTEEVDILSVTPYISGDELMFPMRMFIPPFFHATYPRAMNYGILGTMIAKDIFHLLLQEIHSPSETVKAVADCVWAQYLTATEGTERGKAKSLSATQQQEVWVQYSALQVALQAYNQSLKEQPIDTSLSGRSNIHLFLTSFAQVNCDVDPYQEFMPFKSPFLIMVLCATSQLCPTPLEFPTKCLLKTC